MKKYSFLILFVSFSSILIIGYMILSLKSSSDYLHDSRSSTSIDQSIHDGKFIMRLNSDSSSYYVNGLKLIVEEIWLEKNNLADSNAHYYFIITFKINQGTEIYNSNIYPVKFVSNDLDLPIGLPEIISVGQYKYFEKVKKAKTYKLTFLNTNKSIFVFAP